MKKKILLSVDDDFLREIDLRSKSERMTRSGYIVFCINREMKKHKSASLINDVTSALNALDEYMDDMDTDTKKKVSDLLIQKGSSIFWDVQ